MNDALLSGMVLNFGPYPEDGADLPSKISNIKQLLYNVVALEANDKFQIYEIKFHGRTVN